MHDRWEQHTDMYQGGVGWQLQAQGAYTVTTTVADDDTGRASVDTALLVKPEDARVSFDAANPVAVKVTSPGSNKSQPFSVKVQVQEAPETGGRLRPAISIWRRSRWYSSRSGPERRLRQAWVNALALRRARRSLQRLPYGTSATSTTFRSIPIR